MCSGVQVFWCFGVQVFWKVKRVTGEGAPKMAKIQKGVKPDILKITDVRGVLPRIGGKKVPVARQ